MSIDISVKTRFETVLRRVARRWIHFAAKPSRISCTLRDCTRGLLADSIQRLKDPTCGTYSVLGCANNRLLARSITLGLRSFGSKRF